MRSDYLQTLEGRRRRRRRMWRWGGLGVGVYCVSLLLLLLVFKTPFFEIKSIEITGAKEISDANVLSLVQSQAVRSSWPSRFLGAENILAWPGSFSKQELQFIPSLRSVKVDKDYAAKKIIVKVTEREPYGMWCLMKKDPPACFWFDEDGVMFKQGFSTEGNLIRVVKDYYDSDSGINNSVLPPEFLPNLFPILDMLQKSKLSIKEIGLYHLDLEEVEVTVFNGPKILFSLRFPPQGALEVVDSLKNKGTFRKLNYIDFRVENRAYYK